MKARALLAAVSLLACTPSIVDAPAGVDQWTSIDVEAAPIAAPPQRVDQLVYRGGLHLIMRGDNSGRDFGGLSGLEVFEDGRMLAVSDYGDWIEARLMLDDAGALIGLSDVRGAVMRDEGARIFADKQAADAEGLAQLPDGRLVVSFEQTQTLRIYDLNRDGPFGPAQTGPALLGVAALPPNTGLEALATTQDGRLLVGAEGGEEATTPLWLVNLGGEASAPRATYRPERGYSLTSLDRLPNGDFVALERFYAPVIGARARIAQFSASALEAGGEIAPEELARLDPPLPLDNFEAIAAVRSPDGGVRLYVLSDDNFSARQRTLLLAFDLAQ